MRRFSSILFATSASALSGSSPLSKVVTMLEDVMKKAEDEAKAQEKVHEKASCFVKKTTEKNLKLISESETNIEDLLAEQNALPNVALTDEAVILQKQIDAKSEELGNLQNEHNNMRKTHTATMLDLTSGIDALQNAGRNIGGGVHFLQKDQFRKLLTSNHVSQKQRTLLSGLMKQAPAVYESQVGAIKELIVNLKQQYQAEKLKVQLDHKKSIKAQDALINEASASLESLQEAFRMGMGEAAAKAKRNAEIEDALSLARNAIKEAKDQNDELAEQREHQDKQYTIFLEDNQAQRDAIEKAISILSDDEARVKFQKVADNKSASAFIQLGAWEKSKEGSSAIAFLRKEIANMQSELSSEKENIVATVNKCEADSRQLLENAIADAEQIDGFTSSIRANERKIETEKKRQVKFTEEIAELVEQKKQAKETMEAESAVEQQASDELYEAHHVVEDAMRALQEYEHRKDGASDYHSEDKTNPLDAVITLLHNIDANMLKEHINHMDEKHNIISKWQKLDNEIGHESPMVDSDSLYATAPLTGTRIGDKEQERNKSIDRQQNAEEQKTQDTDFRRSNEKVLYGDNGKSGIFGDFSLLQPSCDHSMVNSAPRKTAIEAEIKALSNADQILSNQDLGLDAVDASGAEEALHKHSHL